MAHPGVLAAVYACLLALSQAPSVAAAAPQGLVIGIEAARQIWPHIKWEQFTSKVLRDLPLRDEGNRKVLELPGEFHVGNCWLRKGARVEFHRNGTVRFHAWGGTDFSMSGDVWHQYFTVRDGDGRVLYKNKEQFRVPERGNLPLIGSPAEVDETQNYDASTFDGMDTVSWHADC